MTGNVQVQAQLGDFVPQFLPHHFISKIKQMLLNYKAPN
jgi:hypothetical protein